MKDFSDNGRWLVQGKQGKAGTGNQKYPREEREEVRSVKVCFI